MTKKDRNMGKGPNRKRAGIYAALLAFSISLGGSMLMPFPAAAGNKQGVREYTTGDQDVNRGDADVEINGVAKGEQESSTSVKPTTSTPSTTKTGAGVNDVVTGGKTVKTGDFASGVLPYIAVFLLGGGVLWFLAKKEQKGNQEQA